jgi:hypothetical protein
MANAVMYQSPPQDPGRRAMKFTYPPESRPLEGYTIKRGIHRGGFGEVYYALSDAGKEVALKLLQNNPDVELRGVAQCLNLKHPNLVTIFDIRCDRDGDHWIVMEFVKGRTLERVIDDGAGQMPIDEVRHWLSGLAGGLSYLHDRGIVHRDLKPANIYEENGVVKIGDVGLSKFISESRRHAQTQSVGTVYYMAPEVAHGRYGREVDIYAAGVILYELLTGRVPFDGESTAEILMKHLSEKPDLGPIPKRLRPVIAAALEKDPMRRTPTIAQLEQEFRKAIAGYDAPEPPPKPAYAQAAPQPVRVRVEERPHARTTHSSKKHQADDAWGYWKWLAIALVVMAIFAPRALGELTRHGFQIGVLVALGYAAYRAVQCVTGGAGCSTSNERLAGNPPRPAPVAYRPGPVPRPRALTPTTPRTLPLQVRLAELTGSMTFAAVCTALVTAAVALISPPMSDPASIGLFAGTTLLGAWAVLVPSKLFEGRKVDPFTRRMAVAACGVALGMVAFGGSELLLVDVNGHAPSSEPLITSIGSLELVDYRTHEPTWAGFVAFFGTLFALRRWWRHADSFRPRRLRIFSLLLTVGLGYLAALIWSFSPWWGVTWAAAISGVVQLSAVWVPPQDRARVMREVA